MIRIITSVPSQADWVMLPIVTNQITPRRSAKKWQNALWLRRLAKCLLRQVPFCVTLYNAKRGQRNIVLPCAKPADISVCPTRKVNLWCLRGCMIISKESYLSENESSCSQNSRNLNKSYYADFDFIATALHFGEHPKTQPLNLQ